MTNPSKPELNEFQMKVCLVSVLSDFMQRDCFTSVKKTIIPTRRRWQPIELIGVYLPALDPTTANE